MIIRTIHQDDAEQFLQLQKTIAEETTFMIRESDEIRITVEQQRERITNILTQDYLTVFVVEHDERLIGFLRASGSNLRRIRHKVYIVIGILQAFTGQGIGTHLFNEAEQWARQQGMTRMELSVMTGNKRGIALYKKCGFVIEGIQKNAFLINDQYSDDYIMAKLLK